MVKKANFIGMIAFSLGFVFSCTSLDKPLKPKFIKPLTLDIKGLTPLVIRRVDNYYRRDFLESIRAEERFADALKKLNQQGDDAILKALYSNVPRFRFIDPKQKNEEQAGRALIGILSDASSHAILVEKKNIEELAHLLLRAEKVEGKIELGLSEKTFRQRIESAIKKLNPALYQGKDADRKIAEEIINKRLKIEGLAEKLSQLKGERQLFFDRYIQAEFAFVRAYLRFARKLGRKNLNPQTRIANWKIEARIAEQKAKEKENSPTSAPASQPSLPLIIKDPLSYLAKVQHDDLATIHDKKSLRVSLDSIMPPQEQYKRLRKALVRYQGIVVRGGFNQVKRFYARLGRKSRHIPALKRRLAQEGFFEIKDSYTRLYDKELYAAITRFARLHLLKVSSRLDRRFFKALNISAETKLQRIKTTLNALRKSSVLSGSTYVLVNIPGFYLEVWQKKKRFARHRLVVGKAYGVKCDEETKKNVLRYATPQQSAQLKNLVFAPYWNVTNDIKQVELDPERGKDFLFYEKNGYEVLKAGTKYEWVRQLPGPANSLGFVKFIFPNPHATFIHDTPQKNLFSSVRRSFSHGCMRVSEPRDLAETILKLDGQWDASRYNELYEDWLKMGKIRFLKETYDQSDYEEFVEKAEELVTKVELKTPIAVHIEYHLTYADEKGDVYFYDDIYGEYGRALDRRVGRRCVPEKKVARREFKELITKVDQLEQQAHVLIPQLKQLRAQIVQLDSKEKKKHYRLVRDVEKKLDQFEVHHQNLARNIRQLHTKLSDDLALRKDRWNDRLVARAVKLQRLFDALHRMTLKAERVIKQASSLDFSSAI